MDSCSKMKEKFPHSKKKSLSVSVVTYRTESALLNRCLSSVINAIESSRDELELSTLWIVENDVEGNKLENRYLNDHRIKILTNEKNLGFSKAHNVALFQEESYFHLFLNPDAFLREDFFIKAIAVFSKEKETALVGPRGINEKEEDLFLAKAFPRLSVLLARGLDNRFFLNLLKREIEEYTYFEKRTLPSFPVQHLSGCCLLGRTEILKKIGGFDEGYFLYFEDFDLCRRIARHGKVIYFTDTTIFHGGGNVGKKSLKHKITFIRSAYKFYRRYGWRI